jgi:hypothetical protein
MLFYKLAKKKYMFNNIYLVLFYQNNSRDFHSIFIGIIKYLIINHLK